MIPTETIEVLPDTPPSADLLLCSRWEITYLELLRERATALVFKFPMPANFSNRQSGASHWRVIHRQKKHYWAMLDTAQQFGTVPPPPSEPWEKARIMSVMVLGGAMDQDNALIRHKSCVDWLVTRGYIKSDRTTCLVWGDFPTQRVSRKEDKTITITLTRRA